jgi:hypothetical protein
MFVCRHCHLQWGGCYGCCKEIWFPRRESVSGQEGRRQSRRQEGDREEEVIFSASQEIRRRRAIFAGGAFILPNRQLTRRRPGASKTGRVGILAH